MMGISYGGISQLFVAATQPPHLAAIAPLSVIDNTQTTLYPGGILNTGFALEWAKDRVDDSAARRPRHRPGAGPRSGSRTATTSARPTRSSTRRRSTCSQKIERNQLLQAEGRRPALAGHLRRTRSTCPSSWPASGPTSRPAATARRSPGHYRHEEEVVHVHQRRPHRLARPGDLQPLVRLPAALRRASRNRELNPAPQARRRSSTRQRIGIHGVTLPDDPIQDEPDLRVGAGGVRGASRRSASSSTTAPAARRRQARIPASSSRSRTFPVPGTKARSLFLGRRRHARRQAPAVAAPTSSPGTPDARPPTDFTGDTGGGTNGLWTDDARATTGRRTRPARRVSYVSRTARPRTRPSSAAARCRSGSARRRRTSTCRRPSPRSGPTARRPSSRAAGCGPTRGSSTGQSSPSSSRCSSLRKHDAKPLPKGKWSRSTIPLYYQGHAYRAGFAHPGHVAAPGGDQPIWAFAETSAERHARGSRSRTRSSSRRGSSCRSCRRRRADRRCRPARACAASPAATTCRSPTRNSAAAELLDSLSTGLVEKREGGPRCQSPTS